MVGACCSSNPQKGDKALEEMKRGWRSGGSNPLQVCFKKKEGAADYCVLEKVRNIVRDFMKTMTNHRGAHNVTSDRHYIIHHRLYARVRITLGINAHAQKGLKLHSFYYCNSNFKIFILICCAKTQLRSCGSKHLSC